ncbi:HAD-like protein [Microthyrium microscopicum]|uniref:HAD-like protein n=1 Tax=Microthyrium microscopicum TaxID=703497 RepID=A0A6A6U535_9PEZI|nr:HAD-like protein [Microthyrium microscopicum]
MSTSLTDFKLLSFDVFGTLIDWEAGLHAALIASPLISQLPAGHELKDRKRVNELIADYTGRIESENPRLLHHVVLAQTFKELCKDFNIEAKDIQELDHDAEIFGASAASYPVFPDTVEALKRLKKHYRLVPLTNSSQAEMASLISSSFQSFEFDAVYTAADIGSYKPDLRNFEYLFDHVQEEFGVGKSQILHVAQR